MDVVLFGPPGAGKGTQAKRLVDKLSVPQVSTGDMMRAERSAGSDLGRKFDEFMSAGKLVPDELVLSLIRDRIARSDASAGVLFDGYPRTVPQAAALDALLAQSGRRINGVIALAVRLDSLIVRATGRRTCDQCGHIYHLSYNPPPSADRCSCGGVLTQRKDDTEEVVRKRFDEYTKFTAPLLEFYDARGIVRKIDGEGAVDEVTNAILKEIESLRRHEGAAR